MTSIIKPQGLILGASAVAVSGAADVAENILATIIVPAGVMGLNGILRVETMWTFTNSANNKLLRWRLGGIGGTAFMDLTATANATYSDVRIVRNRNAANSQVAWGASSGVGGHAFSTGAVTTGAIDTSIAQTIVITGQKALAGETLTLESYLVELLLP